MSTQSPSLLSAPGTPHRAFPLGRRGVLLPLSNRWAAAAGLAMYTASKPGVLLAQRVAFDLVRRLGPRALPGHTEIWRPRLSADTWHRLIDVWQDTCGPVDGMAIYQRRQATRLGLTAVLTRGSTSVAVVKLRADLGQLAREQTALRLVAERGARTFKAPQPMAHGLVDDIAWSAQSCVFTRPHRPVLSLPAGLADELPVLLEGLPDDNDAALPVVAARTTPPGYVPGHRDLSPWNLRRDHTGQVWLFDWEDCGEAPPGGDEAYFWGTAQFVRDTAIPDTLSPQALAWALDLVQGRTTLHNDKDRDDRVLEALAALNAALARAEGRAGSQ